MGVDPTASRLATARSAVELHLRNGPPDRSRGSVGASEGIRTLDHRLGKQKLYR